MKTPLLSAEVEIKVPFFDLDPMEVVWHGNYVKYFEIVRCELLEKIQFGYEQMRDAGYMWPIVELKIKYVKPAAFGQQLLCRAELIEYENRIRIKYQIFCSESGQKLTVGYTTQVAVNLETKEMELVSPPILLRRLGVGND